jgi:hypothetical protein
MDQRDRHTKILCHDREFQKLFLLSRPIHSYIGQGIKIDCGAFLRELIITPREQAAKTCIAMICAKIHAKD